MERPGDLAFANFAFLLLKLIPAYELLKKSVRTGNYEAYSAERRFLLLFCFALGTITHAPMIARDVIQYYHCAPVQVEAAMQEVFALFGEGI